MPRFYIFISAVSCIVLFGGFSLRLPGNMLLRYYDKKISALESALSQLEATIGNGALREKEQQVINRQLNLVRLREKELDFFLRYADPILHKKINGPLPVEWETEVYEKFKQPYRREGSGLSLFYEELNQPVPNKTKLKELSSSARFAIAAFRHDSLRLGWLNPAQFYFANRLFLLNLASVYTTGFECPDDSRIIPELRSMLASMAATYRIFNASFPESRFSEDYLHLFSAMQHFVQEQAENPSTFQHFVFIRDYVNPLFSKTQIQIRKQHLETSSLVDYSLNPDAESIFSKDLYFAQDAEGIFRRLSSKEDIGLLDSLGKMLFFDPLLSKNNERSCASCHKPEFGFADTLAVAFQFGGKERLARNTPGLANVLHQHLLMQDGRFYSLQQQIADVITNPKEMGGNFKQIMEEIGKCETYRLGFEKLGHTIKKTPDSAFVISALSHYAGKFSRFPSSFDLAMNREELLSKGTIEGFNLFMGKSRCATCHFVPQFNGVKPPFTGSEFEVLGTPERPGVAVLSRDKGRASFFMAAETQNAFRTPSLRNLKKTRPYMHNGAFQNLRQVLDFYCKGGGKGMGMNIPNQTLPSDSLQLSEKEKENLLEFLESLEEKIPKEEAPRRLPVFRHEETVRRVAGGKY